MRKTGLMGWVLGALAGAALLAGCDDQGRKWAMTAHEDYLPDPSAEQAGEDSATGGAGLDPQMRPEQQRVTPDALAPLLAQDLGTGKPLRANAQGVWVQGTYAVELGSGLIRSVAPASAPFQPQQMNIGGNIATPQQPPPPHRQ